MSDPVYKLIELTGTSKTSIEDAIQTAVSKAAKTIHNMKWFVVSEQRGYIDNNAVAYYQVTLKIGFTLED
ncbi:MAG: dodecin family protein [Ignavibacteriaceae bacterium]|jgi:dodecin